MSFHDDVTEPPEPSPRERLLRALDRLPPVALDILVQTAERLVRVVRHVEEPDRE